MQRMQLAMAMPKACIMLFGRACSSCEDHGLENFADQICCEVGNSEIYVVGPCDLLQRDWYSPYQPPKQDVEWNLWKGYDEERAIHEATNYSHSVVDRSWERAATEWAELNTQRREQHHGTASMLIFIGISNGGMVATHIAKELRTLSPRLAGLGPPCQLPAGGWVLRGPAKDGAHRRPR